MHYLIILPQLTPAMNMELTKRIETDPEITDSKQFFDTNWIISTNSNNVPSKVLELLMGLTSTVYLTQLTYGHLKALDDAVISSMMRLQYYYESQLEQGALPGSPHLLTGTQKAPGKDVIPLSQLVLPDDTKTAITRYIQGIAYEDIAAQNGIDFSEGLQHVLISGPPGAGKTTLAKTLADEILNAKYPKGGAGPVKVIKQTDVIAGFCGQTTTGLQKFLTDHAKGVLVFDEIDNYSSIAHFGPELLNGLNAHMGNHPNSPVVIGTLYESTLPSFLASNPGFSSRFRTQLSLPGQDDKTLATAFEKAVLNKGMTLEHGAVNAVEHLMMTLRKSKKGNFGYMREVGNALSFVRENLAERFNTHQLTNPDQAFDFVSVRLEDIPVKDTNSQLLVKRAVPAQATPKTTPKTTTAKIVPLFPPKA